MDATDNILNDARLRAADRKKEREADSRKESMEDRIARARKNFSAQWNQASLPTVEKDPDWHYCWLSTTNSYDPIHQRMQLGYEPVRPEDVAGKLSFNALPMQSGEFAGCVSLKEMVLFRIPSEIYQVAMEEMHHNGPNQQEDALKALFDELKHGSHRGLTRDVGEGANSFETAKPAPIFQ